MESMPNCAKRSIRSCWASVIDRLSQIRTEMKLTLSDQTNSVTTVWVTNTSILCGTSAGLLHDRCLRLLDNDEYRRYQRFRFERDRLAFLLSHALTRLVIALSTSNKPSNVTYERLPEGKPILPARYPSFNLSHSHEWIAVMLAEFECGVDIEFHREIVDYRAIGKRYFTEPENAVIAESNDPLSDFLKIWTLKEAYLKALGVGMARPMEEFSVIDRTGLPCSSDALPGGASACYRRSAEWHLSAWSLADRPSDVRICELGLDTLGAMLQEIALR